MTSCSAYSRGLTGSYDSDLLTKLVNNYRSHRAIIEIPKQLFYDDELNERAGEFRWVWKHNTWMRVRAFMFKAMRVQWLVRKGALSCYKACILNLCMFCEIIMHSRNRRFRIRNLNWILCNPMNVVGLSDVCKDLTIRIFWIWKMRKH